METCCASGIGSVKWMLCDLRSPCRSQGCKADGELQRLEWALSLAVQVSHPSLQNGAKAGFDAAVLAEWSDCLLPPIAAVAVNVKVQLIDRGWLRYFLLRRLHFLLLSLGDPIL